MFAATIIAFIVWKSHATIDLSKEEAPFNSIALPLKSVRGNGMLDGGPTVIVLIMDSKGDSYKFVFPNDPDLGRDGYHGAFDPFAPGAVAFKDSSRARTIVLQWLSAVREKDEGTEFALKYLSMQNQSSMIRLPREFIRNVFK
jgi:hypothetical protein